MMRRGLILVAAACSSTAPGHLLAQQSRSPLDALLTFVEADVRTAVPPEMRPYQIGRLFLRVDSRAPERAALGSVGRDVLDRLHVEIVDHTMRLEHMMVRVPDGGAHIREEGVYVSVGTVEPQAPDTLAITFAYYVTMRRPRRRPAICLEERRIVVTRTREGNTDSEVVDSKRLGGC